MFFAVQCNPRMEVRDLFRDIQDGKILMALLEELSGCKLVRIIIRFSESFYFICFHE